MGRTMKIRLDGDVDIGFLTGRGGEWLGIGHVRVGKVPLRDASRPAVLRIDTPDGYLYTRYEWEGCRPSGQGIDVMLRAIGMPWGRQEYQDEYNQPLFAVRDDLAPVTDEVVLHFRPRRLTLGGRDWTGFSYSFEFRSRQRQVHRLLFDATWEVGGSFIGNTLLNQSQCSRPVYKGTRGSAFLTSCLKRLDQADSPQGMSYQLAPRGGMLQSFDFQHGKAGALLQYWEGFPAISSDLRKPRGSTRLHVLDEYRLPLSRHLETPPQHVLLSPGPVSDHEGRDLWWAAYEKVADGVCRRVRVKRTEVEPEFDPPRRGRLHEGRLQCSVAGEWVDAGEVPYAVADRLLERAAKAGVRRLMNVFVTENDASVLGFARKLDNGLDGDLFCGSVCSTHRFYPSEFWGGMKAWRYLYEAGKRAGIQMGHWFAPHMSPRAAIFKEHPEWLATGVHTLSEGGGYWNILAALDWNTPVYEWILEDLRRWREEGGLDYLFIDSWPNLGLLPHNYERGMRGNHEPLARFFSEVQAMGIAALSFEGLSTLGISRMAVADLKADDAGRTLDGVVGQNDYAWWHQDPDMAYNLNLHLRPRGRSESEMQQSLFRIMANRGGLILPGVHRGDYEAPEWLVRLNRIYNHVHPHMRVRHVLPNGAGILWTGGGRSVVWVFKPIPSHDLCQLQQVAAEGLFSEFSQSEAGMLSPYTVYCFTKA